MEATRWSGRFHLPFARKSSSFDVAPDAFSFFPLRPPPQQQLWEEDEDQEDCCWLPELTEPEEVKLLKSSQELAQVVVEKERCRSFDLRDMSSSPRPKLPAGAEPPKRLSLAYGPGEMSKALQVLMSLQSDSDAESRDGEEGLKKKVKTKRDRSRHRRSLFSLLLRRTASNQQESELVKRK